MNLNALIQIIKEEIHDFYSDWESEPSVLDKYGEKNLGIAPSTNKNPDVQINGELIGYVDKQAYQKLDQPIPVYKNPKTLDGFSQNTRGILLPSGDLYVAQNYKALHDNILELLADKNIIDRGKIYNYGEYYPKDFVAVVRAGNSKTFGQSSAYDIFPNQYLEIFDNGDQKQPYYFQAYKF